MFDTVIVEDLKLLPEPSKPISSFLKQNSKTLASDFQTKDLDNSLLTYYIDKKGNISVETRVATGRRVKRSLIWQAWKDNRTFLERLYFKLFDRSFSSFPYKDLKTVPEFKTVKSKSDLTQTFNIYNFNDVGGRYVDVEYSVEAIKGKVKTIKLVRSNLESESDARKRNKQNEEFERKMAETIEARRVFTSKWYYPVLREIYNPIVFFSRKIIQFVCQKIIHWTYRWHTI